MIVYNKKKKMFYIGTKDSSYIFGVNSQKCLFNAYYGKKLNSKQLIKISEPVIKEIAYHMSDNKKSNYMPEINLYDGYNVFENTVKISFSDGTRSLDCVYSGYRIKDSVLEVILKDRKYNLSLVLIYKVNYELNLIEKSMIIRNNEKKISAVFETCNSGDMILPAGKYNLGYFHGGWIKEMSLRFEEISYGRKVIESRTGHSSHIHNPSFFITKEEKVSEDSGECFYGQLMWGGSFKFTFEKRQHGVVAFTGGINSFDGMVTLGPKKKFVTPGLLLGYSDKGTGKMSRQLHDYYRQNVIPKESLNNHKRILVNSWEAFYFSNTEEKLLKLADRAKEIGAEILVVDDGWFRKRDNDGNSLGDWKPIPRKFPDGMEAFGKKIRAKGLKFGIWLEPEAVNTDSDLYRNHPDWVYHFKDRPRYEMRHTLVLDLRKKEVIAYLKKMIHRVITEYKPDYVKWDMNRYISEMGPSTTDASPYIEHTMAAYELMDYLKSLKPDIILEGCAGGGGRMSGGFLAHVDQMWASDDNDPFCRQIIQYGTSLFYPAQVMCCHVADSPYCLTGRKSTPLYRVRTAMAGNLGTEANLLEWNQAELKVLKDNVELYKSIRDIVFCGDLFRIESPYNGNRVSFMYVTKDKTRAVLYVYNNGKGALGGPNALEAGDINFNVKGRIKLKGLLPGAMYELDTDGRKTKAKGSRLMKTGILVPVDKIQEARIIKLQITNY